MRYFRLFIFSIICIMSLKYEKPHNLDIKNLTALRVNVLLQDKKHGHFLDVNNQTVEHYAKGDYVYIFPGVLHSVANVGYENRYTLQVTGYADLG